jgi:hypothetical protein
MFTLIRRNARGKAMALAGAVAVVLGAATVGSGVSNAAVPTQASPAASVPWSQVGPGWSLGLVSAGSYQKAAPSTLYLASPAGRKYRVFAWPATADVPYILAWSPAKTEALIETQPGSDVHKELNLRTGKVTTTFNLSDDVSTQYALPGGGQLLVWQVTFGPGGFPADRG